MIQRIFHPIGQGAFYAEKHPNFNIVYDCGSWKFGNSKEDDILADNVVEKSFTKDDKIDILFISHFDIDHVNKIDILKKTVKKIEKVVLPLLHEKEENLLINIYNNSGLPHIATLISNPQEYFGNDIQIITVGISESNENPATEEPRYIEELNNPGNIIEIKSGTILRRKTEPNWVFIPYNHEYRERRKKLENNFIKEGVDINELLKNNIQYMENNRKAIKKAYNALEGQINQNSMFLYSGPVNTGEYFVVSCYSGHRYYTFDSWLFYPRFIDNAGCIYTGDGDLNKSKIKSIYKNFWPNVGTIQIPHHGSLNSFDKDFLDTGNYICPISAGTKNSHDHPSPQVISSIIESGSFPVRVKEHADSIFIEEIGVIPKQIRDMQYLKQEIRRTKFDS